MISKREWREMKNKAKILKEASAAVSVEDKDLLRTVERFKKEIEEMKRRLGDSQA